MLFVMVVGRIVVGVVGRRRRSGRRWVWVSVVGCGVLVVVFIEGFQNEVDGDACGVEECGTIDPTDVDETEFVKVP